MQPLPRLVEIELRSPRDDLLLMLKIIIDHLAEVQHLGLAIHERNHDNAEGILKLGMLIEIIQDDICIYIFFKLNNDPHTGA